MYIVLKDEGEDLHHLPVTAGPPQQTALQSLEGVGEIGKAAPLRKAPGFR